MKLAVKKEEGRLVGGGFHYMLHLGEMRDDNEAAMFRLLGYHIIEVSDGLGTTLLTDAKTALTHKIEIATITEQQIKNFHTVRL